MLSQALSASAANKRKEERISSGAPSRETHEAIISKFEFEFTGKAAEEVGDAVEPGIYAMVGAGSMLAGVTRITVRLS